MIDKITKSVWFLGIGIVSMPIFLICFQVDPFLYYLFAAFFYLNIMIKFCEAVIVKLNKKINKLERT